MIPSVQTRIDFLAKSEILAQMNRFNSDNCSLRGSTLVFLHELQSKIGSIHVGIGRILVLAFLKQTIDHGVIYFPPVKTQLEIEGVMACQQ